MLSVNRSQCHHSAKDPFSPDMDSICDGNHPPINLTDADVTGLQKAELFSPYARTRAAATADAKAAVHAAAAAEARAAAIEADDSIEAVATWSRVVTEVRDHGPSRKAALQYINRDELLPNQADLCFYDPKYFHDPRYEDVMFVGKNDLALLRDELGYSWWKWAVLGLALLPACASSAVWCWLRRSRRRSLEATYGSPRGPSQSVPVARRGVPGTAPRPAGGWWRLDEGI